MSFPENELAFTPEMCKLCHTEIKDNFKEDAGPMAATLLHEMTHLYNLEHEV